MKPYKIETKETILSADGIKLDLCWETYDSYIKTMEQIKDFTHVIKKGKGKNETI